MLAEFAQLPNQEREPALESRNGAGGRALQTRESGTLILRNVHKHLNCLKASLSVLLLRLFAQPADNGLVDDRTHASVVVLRTLDEMNRSCVEMEKWLLDVQYVSLFNFLSSKNTLKRNTRPQGFDFVVR